MSTKAEQTRMRYRPKVKSRIKCRPGVAWFIALVCCTSIAAMGAALQESGVLVVEKPEENIRSAPNGQKTGTLFKGAEIEKIGEDGKWIRFRMEGWIWGPSLEAGVGSSMQTSQDPASEAKSPSEEKSPAGLITRKPRSTIQVNLSQVRELVNESYGVFYSIDHDKELLQLIVRFRLEEKVGRDVLERRQAVIQGQLLDLFVDGVEFTSIRVETNRPDGSGQVGVEIAVTDVADFVEVDRVAEVDDDLLDRWKAKSRISTDAGATWSR